MITSEADLTVSSLRSPNYAGAVIYLRTIIAENGKSFRNFKFQRCLRSAILVTSCSESAPPWSNRNCTIKRRVWLGSFDPGPSDPKFDWLATLGREVNEHDSHSLNILQFYTLQCIFMARITSRDNKFRIAWILPSFRCSVDSSESSTNISSLSSGAAAPRNLNLTIATFEMFVVCCS